jgi:hypothetical protein
MKKAMLVGAMVVGVALMALASRPVSAAAREGRLAAEAEVTAEQVNAVIDARLHELLAQKIADARARAEIAASEQ